MCSATDSKTLGAAGAAEGAADGWGGGVDKSSIQPVRNKKGQKSAFSRVSVDNFVDILRRCVRAGAAAARF